MQKIFSQEIRFKSAIRSPFPDWQKMILGKVTNIQKGEQLNKENLSEKGLYPCVNGGVLPSGYTENFNVNKNTIIISEGGNSCGYVNFMKTEFWSGGHCYTLEVSDKVNKYFLFQNLKYQQDKIMALRVGSGLPNIQKKDLSKFKVSIPLLLNEQEKIANFLTAIDRKIEAISRQIDQTKQFKKGLLQKLFV